MKTYIAEAVDRQGYKATPHKYILALDDVKAARVAQETFTDRTGIARFRNDGGEGYTGVQKAIGDATGKAAYRIYILNIQEVPDDVEFCLGLHDVHDRREGGRR